MNLHPDELEVYRACLKTGMFGVCAVVSDNTNAGTLTALGREEFWAMVPLMRKVSMPTLEADTCDEYVRKNLAASHLNSRFQDNCGVVLIPNDTFQEHLRDQDFGPMIRKLYPSSIGLLQFSRPGFNRNRTQALIYYGHLVDSLASSGVFELYALHESTWCLSGRFTEWES